MQKLFSNYSLMAFFPEPDKKHNTLTFWYPQQVRQNEKRNNS